MSITYTEKNPNLFKFLFTASYYVQKQVNSNSQEGVGTIIAHFFPLSHFPADVCGSDTNTRFLQNPICSVVVMQNLPRKVLIDLGSSVEQPAMWIPLTARWEG